MNLTPQEEEKAYLSNVLHTIGVLIKICEEEGATGEEVEYLKDKHKELTERLNKLK